MNRITLLLASAILIGSSAANAGGDVEAGKQLVTTVCAACHGVDGNSELPANPKLAGQYESYLIKSLRDYRSGDRKNPIMAGFAASLSDEDINNVAAYFSSQTGDLSTLN